MPLRFPKAALFGRPIKPVALGLTVAMLIIWPSAITDEGVLDGSFWGDFIGWWAFGIAAVLITAWWTRWQRLYEFGLQMVFTLMIFRFVASFLVNDGEWTQSGALSIAWAIIAGGSYILEKNSPPGRQDE